MGKQRSQWPRSAEPSALCVIVACHWYIFSHLQLNLEANKRRNNKHKHDHLLPEKCEINHISFLQECLSK